MAVACSCSAAALSEVRAEAGVIFTGKITAINLVDPEQSWEPRVVVEFEVSRMWKGAVKKRFTAYSHRQASTCSGFWPTHLKVGTELLFFGFPQRSEAWKQGRAALYGGAASQTVRPKDRSCGRLHPRVAALGDGETVYAPMLCTRTRPVGDAAEDLKALGAGKAPLP